MTRRFLKVPSGIIASLMLAGTLAACGGDKKASETTKPQAQQTQKITESLKPVTLEWLAYDPLTQPDPEAEIIKMVEKKFNVKLNIWFVDQQKYVDALSVRLAAGEMPDVLLRKPGLELQKLINQGIAKELPIETLKQKAPKYMKMVEEYDTEGIMFINTTVNGKNYGFSNYNLNSSYPNSVVYRMDWLKNVGINKVPETLAEFEDAITKMTKNDPDKNGKNDTFGLSDRGLPIVFGAFGHIPFDIFRGNPLPELQYMKKDGKVAVAAVQPEMKEALALVSKWYKAGLIDPEFITGENKGGYVYLSHAMVNNKIGVSSYAMFYHYQPPLTEGEQGGRNYQEWTKVNPNVKYGETFVLGKPPVAPNGKSGTVQWSYVVSDFVITTKVDEEPRKLDAILSMLDAACEDTEYATTIEYGIKGTDYKIDEKTGTYVRIVADVGELRKKGMQTFNFCFNYPTIAKAAQPLRYKFADETKVPNGYISVSVPSTDASLKYGNDLKKLVYGAYIEIITGSKPLDYFDEMVEQFSAKGGDELEKQATEAYKNAGGKLN